jgi:hypothetical protein
MLDATFFANSNGSWYFPFQAPKTTRRWIRSARLTTARGTKPALMSSSPSRRAIAHKLNVGVVLEGAAPRAEALLSPTDLRISSYTSMHGRSAGSKNFTR